MGPKKVGSDAIRIEMRSLLANKPSVKTLSNFYERWLGEREYENFKE